MGADLKKQDLDAIFNLSKQIQSLFRYQQETEKYLESIMDKYPKITIVCITTERTEKILIMKNVITMPKNNYNLLSKRLREISSESLKESYWTDMIDEVKKYIKDNIKSIKSSEQIAENFNIEHRKLCLEFKQKTGKTIRAYITDIRFIMLTDILKNTTEIGNYYAIARECGLHDDRVLYNIVKKKTNKTPMEYHRDLLIKKSIR